MSAKSEAKKTTWVDKFLDGVERVCNKLPPPAILFFWLFLFVAVLGMIFSFTGISLLNPATGDPVSAQNFFSTEGLHWFLRNMVTNFSGFAPLGLVISMTLAIGICEEAGLIMSMLKSALKNVPAAIVPFMIAFIGTLGNIASDTAMVIIPPMAAIVYIGVGKHPIVGMIVGYAGAQAGFTANLLPAGTDSLLQGLTNQAIDSFLEQEAAFVVDVTCNYYFMIASTFLCALVIGLVSIKVIEPRFPKYEAASDEGKIEEVTPLEKKGLNFAGIWALLFVAVVAVTFFAFPGVLSKDDGGLVGSMLLTGLIPILFLFFASCGLVYGFTSKSFKNTTDVNKAMVKQMSAMGAYVAFCFFCGQFQSLFAWTRLDTMLAISGANFLSGIGFSGIPLFVAFILLCAFVNIFVSSGSAKWAIFAPIFVPMFMILGYHPGFTQLLYRLGDSPGNCFTPMSPYIWMVLSVAQAKYDKDLSIGKIVANMIPIAVVLQIAWIIFMIIWVLIGVDIGPGTGTAIPAELAAMIS